MGTQVEREHRKAGGRGEYMGYVLEEQTWG